MAALKLSLLGPFLAALNDQPIDTFPTSKVQALLIYLAVERSTAHRREHLMELLWTGMPLESAQVNLRQTLYRLRKNIPEVSGQSGDTMVPLLLTDRQIVQLNPEADLELDLAAFQAQIDQDPALAVTHYRGDFLTDFYLVDSSAFEAWAEGWRENLRRRFLETLFDLAEAELAIGDYPQAQTCAWRQLEFDHLSERAYRQLMTALAHGGQRNAALAQYQVCRRRLARELGLEPSPETTALYEQIQATALQAAKEPPAHRQRKPGDMPVFLLTDIEGSTRLWDTYRQAMLPALLQHNAILEEHITRHGGRILELRGDGVKAVFEGINPLQCMLDIQKSLGTAEWGEIGDLRIRMGLHGVPAVHKDFDYFVKDDIYYGPVINHTSRIMDAGHGGQILVSESVHNTFALPAGARWQDFGKHEVKSLDQPLQIYGLIHPDLPHQSFSSLRTGSVLEKHVRAETAELKESLHRKASEKSIRHNLPAQTTPFIGREDELEELETMIADPDTRLVTIVGPGGMGKTRLGLATAQWMLESTEFPDGVFFIDLTHLVEPSQIASAVAESLNIHLKGQEERSPQQQLHDYLRSRKLLLLLDNCEHLLEGIELVAKILQAAPEVQVLATSRERLHLSLEQVYPIDGLEFPDWETPEDAAAYAAVRLFLQSAHRNQPDFSLLGEMDLTYLARICCLVAGMPLALELAASWVDTLPLSEIAAGIKEGLDFLESELRDLPARHRSLQATIDYSWEKLTQQEQVIFASLSVFRGGFTREAAHFISGANFRQLSLLVNKSFLQYDQRQDRFKVHELLRQYGAAHLRSNPSEEQKTLQQHSEFFCLEVEKKHLGPLEDGTQMALDRFAIDAPNILVAWNWVVKYENYELIDLAVDGICEYYSSKMQFDVVQSHCHSLLDLLSGIKDGKPSDPFVTKRLRTKILLWLGLSSVMIGQYDQAADFLELAEKMIHLLVAKEIDIREVNCKWLVYQGFLNLNLRHFDRARAYYKDALKLCREIGLKRMILWTQAGMGNIAASLDFLVEFETWNQEYLTEARAQGNQEAEIAGLERLGWAARFQKSYDKARSYFDESIKLANKYNHRRQLVFSLMAQGGLSLFLGHFDQAVELYSQSIAESIEFESAYFCVRPKTLLGIAYWLSGEFNQAEIVLKNASSIGQESPSIYLVWSFLFYAEYLVMVGRCHQASQLMAKLDDLAEDINLDADDSSRIARVLGWIALRNDDYVQSRFHFDKSIGLSKSITDIEEISWSQAGFAAAAMFQGQRDEAYQLFYQALGNSIDMQSIIPLLHLLPFICLFTSQDEPQLARDIFAKIQTSPFLANAQFFKDTVYRHLPDKIKQTKRKEDSYLSESEMIQNLWETAAKIMALWETDYS